MVVEDSVPNIGINLDYSVFPPALVAGAEMKMMSTRQLSVSTDFP